MATTAEENAATPYRGSISPKLATVAPLPNIHHRMVAILRDLDAIGKDQRNDTQKFNYRGIDQVYNAINPLLAKHGVYMTATILGKTREERASKTGGILAFTCLRMRYHFHAEDGSTIYTEAEGEGMDSGDKSSNKGMAVAHKYAILQAFCVPTKDLDDPDAHSHEVVAKPEHDPDPDGQTSNWVNTQKATITAAQDLPAVYEWVEKFCGEGPEATVTSPQTGSVMARLKAKSPALYKGLVAHYQAKVETFSKHV